MNWFKRSMLALGFGLVATVAALGATLPLVPSNSQYSEPSQIVGTLNYLVGLINANWSTQITAIPAPVTTSGTSANTVFQTQVKLAVGQAVHVRIWGVNSADANAKTVTLNYGSGPTALATAVTGSGAKWYVNCSLQNVGVPAAPVVQMECDGAQAATLITVGQTSDTTDDATTVQNLSLTMTAATSGTMTAQGAWAGYVR